MNEYQKVLIERHALEVNDTVECDYEALTDAYVSIFNHADVILEIISITASDESIKTQYYIVVYVAREYQEAIVDNINTCSLFNTHDRIAVHLFDSLSECYAKHDQIRNDILKDYSV